MVNKKVAVCGNCLCRLGVTFDRRAIIPAMYCAVCEPIMTIEEETKEAETARYRAAARFGQWS